MLDRTIDVHIRSYSPGHVDCFVTHDGGSFRFTGFYGNPVIEQRKFSWDLLKRLGDQLFVDIIPWLVGGDFNEILMDMEKEGGRPRPLRQINFFREVLFYCHLNEVEHPDRNLTWFNKREGEPIFERLETFLGNEEWQTKFLNASTRTLDFYGSDHRPVVCWLDAEKQGATCRGKGRFHFEDKWFLEKGFVPDFLCEWASLSHEGDLTHKLNKCKKFFSRWASKNCNRS